MDIHIYNTLTNTRERFVPADPDRVTMYVCGPTVYSHPHIGNARPAVVFDVFYRLLKHEFPHVVYARNITDVDDKINVAALREKVPIARVSARYTDIYHDDMAQLGVLPPTVEPRATEHILQIIEMVQRLIATGNAYEAKGHVLFYVPSYAGYGELSGRNTEGMIAGARVEVAPFKRNPADFVLWKPSDEGQPAWDSPWGKGRPGWHIECSAMAKRHLGETIDVHGGGQDLVFPHHENERAQSTCAHNGKLFSRYWMHNGFVNVEHEKMSKSSDNVLLVCDLLRQVPGEVVRFTLLGTHYRKPLDWTHDVIRQNSANLNRLYGTLLELKDADVEHSAEDIPESFLDMLKDDLNTPAAFAELHKLARQANNVHESEERRKIKKQLLAAGGILGLLKQDPVEWFQGTGKMDEEKINALIQARVNAKKNKSFELADSIREKLVAMGVNVQDRPDGTSTWRKKLSVR